ncbi:MAG: hypothetical protein RLZZ30_1235 [Bacteroidota bacterium]|jgi:tRNA1Val (adenine37-N6)-methyltransferase
MVLGALIPAQGKMRGLDIGTGTGVLSLMALQQNPRLEIDAIEIHETAAKECAWNVQHSPWPNSVQVHSMDFLSFESAKTYDLIFSNPPFYVDGLKSGNETQDQAKHMSREQFDLFVRKAAELLSNEGIFTLIIPGDQRSFLLDLGKSYGLFPARIIAIHANTQKLNKRVIVDFVKDEREVIQDELTIRNLDGSYHDAYISLTKDFHLTDLSK